MPRPSRRFTRVSRIAWFSAALVAVGHLGPCLVSGQADPQDEAARMAAQVADIFSTPGPPPGPGDESTGGGSAPDVVTESEVAEAQRAWGDGIVDIGIVEAAGLDFEARAGQMVDSLYAFGVADVLFKPTMAETTPFRTTRAGVVSYFISGDGVTTTFPEDTEHGGFARRPWSAVRFEPAGGWLGPGAALSMGHYHFMDADEVEHTAEFSFAYVRDGDGHLRIALHHSSFPYCGEEFVNGDSCTLPSGSATVPASTEHIQAASAERRLDSATVNQSAIVDAEQRWGSGIVDLGRAPAADVHDGAVDFVTRLYSYGGASPPWAGSGALFKPTRAREAPFRTTLDGAVSYFVGGDVNFAEDHGFALAPWGSVRFDSAGTTRLSPSLVVTMGAYFFTDAQLADHRVEYSIAFVPGDSGPKIALHHSSFPFCSTCVAGADAAVAALGVGGMRRAKGTGHIAAIFTAVCAAAVLVGCCVVFSLLAGLRGTAFGHFMRANGHTEQEDTDEESVQE